MSSRSVSWGDLQNAWDLGGLHTTTGVTQRGRIFRSMNPDPMDAVGWADLLSSGIETIVDLRNDYEVVGATHRPDTIVVHRRAIEDQGDEEFMAEWGDRLGSPVYYAEVLRRWPTLIADAVSAIADSAGPVLFHCGAGRDRMGMISAMIEDLVSVDRSAILDDYAAAARAFNVWKRSNPFREPPQSDADLEAHLNTAIPELSAFLDNLDVGSYLLGAGVTHAQLARLRSRLLDA